MRLRTRLIVFYTGLILLGFAGLALWAGQQIETAAEEDFEHRTESEVALLAQALTEPVEEYIEGETTQDAVTRILENYAAETGSDLTLINNQGAAWLSTTTPEAGYLTLPEIITARDNRITHETRQDDSGTWRIYTAAPLTEDGRIISVVQLVVPVDQVQASVQRRWAMLGTGVSGLGLVVVLVSLLVSASLTRPLAELQEAANHIASGDFSIHLPDQRRDEIGAVARSFNTMSARVQAMLEEQRAFSSNVSHELRTPLTTIQLRVEALLNGNTDKTDKYLHEINSEIQRMRNLVDDLILLSRFEAGSVEIGRDQVDLPRFARRLMKELATDTISMTLDAADTLPPISANLTHLHVVFRNILDNAIKYMEGEGSIDWKITLQDGQIVSTITDTGVGISLEDQQAIMRRFYRADKSHSRTIEGAGLGLPLAKSIVDAYGGFLRLNSDGLGHGTQVILAWPREVASVPSNE
jgi:signal transduction histidine kinase